MRSKSSNCIKKNESKKMPGYTHAIGSRMKSFYFDSDTLKPELAAASDKIYASCDVRAFTGNLWGNIND